MIERMRQNHLHQLIAHSKIGQGCKQATFGNFDTGWHARYGRPDARQKDQNLADAWSIAFAYAKFDLRERPAFTKYWQPMLTLVGANGCGKSHLAAAIYNYRNDPVAQTSGAAFWSVPDLLDYLRATFGPDSQEKYDDRLERIRAAPCLILDDLMLNSATPWALEKLFQLIEFRVGNHSLTILTTNEELGDLPMRISSRLSGGKVFSMIGDDYRAHVKGRTTRDELEALRAWGRKERFWD
jgi:DNA replication protein DnaC